MTDVTSSERFLVSSFVSDLWIRIPPFARSGKAGVTTEIALAAQLGVDPAHIVDRAEAYYKSHEGRGEYRMKIKNFIANGCYDDDPAAWGPRTRKDTGGMGSTGALETARRQRLEYEAERGGSA